MYVDIAYTRWNLFFTMDFIVNKCYMCDNGVTGVFLWNSLLSKICCFLVIEREILICCDKWIFNWYFLLIFSSFYYFFTCTRIYFCFAIDFSYYLLSCLCDVNLVVLQHILQSSSYRFGNFNMRVYFVYINVTQVVYEGLLYGFIHPDSKNKKK